MSIQVSWYKRVKQAVEQNIPVIVTVGAAITAGAAALYVRDLADDIAESSEASKEALRSIEQSIQTAIECPTIVKVEIGDDIELIGHGNRID